MAEVSENARRLAEVGQRFNTNIPAILAGEEIEVPDIYSPDLVLTNFEPSPFPGTYRGYEGLYEWTRDLMTDFDDGRVDLLEFSESGDEIATKLKFTGTGHRSGIETSLVWGALWRFRNGLIVEVNGYPSYEEALERLSG